ncbi:MAG: hypothetical protein KDI06_07465, partial [Calditrichaeota bacterium]|nr:hypothetical protein [Calditrichota bacterium]
MISEKSGLGGIDLFDGQPRPPRDPGDEVISPRTVALKRRYGSVFHAPRTSDVQFSPSLLEDLRRLLRENHLLLLVGSEITQHERYQFAFVLAQYLNQHHKDSRKILCWRPWVNLDDFPAYLADFPKKDAETGKWAPGIFIFPEVEAHHFQYSLAAMIDIARIRHHTVILTTTIPQNEWLTLWEKLSSPETEDSDLSTLPHPQVFGKHLFNLRRDEIYRDEDAAFQFLYESAAEDDFRSSGNREPISAKRYQEKAYLGINLLHRLYRSKTALLGKQKLEFDESYTLQLDIENDLREMLSFPIARERTVLQVARRLRNLGDVDRFVDLMTANHRVQVSSSSGEPRPTLGLPPVGEEEASSYFATEDVDRILRAFPEKDLQENALNGKAVQESVQIWYGKLDERQRHLLLGLCLLNGLYDKQFFMALEELVENDWRAAESIPGDFDYRDFGPLQEYLFVGVDNGENETILKIAPRLWRRIFRECWRENQRLMVKSVSSLLNLVKNAILVETGITFTFTQNTLERLSELGVSESFLAPLSQFLGRTFSRQAEFFREVSRLLGSLYLEHHKEAFKIAFDSQLLFSREDFREIETIEHQTQLYGHKGKNVLLRAVVSNTLAELGSEDPGYIRETLLRLAMDKEESLRDFSAEALGKWRNWPAGSSVRAQQDEAFIQIVQRWQKNPEQEFDPQGSGLPADQKAHIKNCKEIIRATVLSAVGQAAIYDLPNTCDARLMAQLVQLTKQAFPEMRKKLGAVSLPLFM